MIKRTTYKAAHKPPRACIDPGDTWDDCWTYNAGHKDHIEVHDQEEGEQWADTGLLDLQGNPVWRITRYVRRYIGFIGPESDE